MSFDDEIGELNGIAENFTNKLGEWQTRVEDCQATVDGYVERFGQIEERLDQFNSVLPSMKEVIDEKWENVVNQIDSVMETIEANFDAKGQELQSLEQFAVNMIESKFGEVTEMSSTVAADAVNKFKQAWCDATTQLLERTETELKETIAGQITQFCQVGDQLRDAVTTSMQQLKQKVSDDLTNTVEEEGRKTIDSALERVKMEIMEGIITSQVQVQITGYLSPYIPHLVAAKALAPSVQRALEIMRAGF